MKLFSRSLCVNWQWYWIAGWSLNHSKSEYCFFSHQTYGWKGNERCKTRTYWTPLPSLHTQPSHFEASPICKWMWPESHQRAFLFSICLPSAGCTQNLHHWTHSSWLHRCPVNSLQFSLGVQRGWVNLERHKNWVQCSIFKICAVLQKGTYVL